MWHQHSIAVGTLLLFKNNAHFLITLPLATSSSRPRVPSALPPVSASPPQDVLGSPDDQAPWRGEVKAQGALAVKSEKHCRAQNETNPFL